MQRHVVRALDSGAVLDATAAERALASMERATGWLVSSGIQDQGSSQMRGGVHAWYDTGLRSFAFYYTEITGYGLTSLLFLEDLRRDGRYVDRARSAADWLLTQACDPGSGTLRCRFDVHGVAATRACSFDNAMCLNGLVNLYRLTGERRYLDAGVTIGSWLTDTMQLPTGSLVSKFDLLTSTPHDPGGKWSLIQGSYLVKAAIGLANLADATGDERIARSVRMLCDWGLDQQQADGRFPTSPPDGDTYLHPHCYGAEGLLVAGTVFGERSWVEAAARAVAWIARAQLPTGGFPAYLEGGRFVPLESPEVSAQVLRLWLLLPPDLRPPLDVAAATRRIEEGQLVDSAPEADGAFAAGPAWFHNEPHDHSGKHANAWATMMALQTLALAAGVPAEFPVLFLV